MRQTTLDGGSPYVVYDARKILNKYRHADSWFWNTYSAHPYVGCEHACEYCYARQDKYLHTDAPEDFSRIIRVKRNAAHLMQKELRTARKGIIATGDYQPAERRFGLSRKILEVIRDSEFPVHLIEKSDLVVRDVDILKEINERTWACVSFSFSTIDQELSGLFEPGAPSPENRLKAMKEISEAGILTGANLMPLLPSITDSPELMEDVIRAAKAHGATFVLVGGLTLEDNVRERYFKLLRTKFPWLVSTYETLYGSDSHKYFADISRKAIDIIERHGLKDRIPRYCLNFNQRVAEKLYDQVYRFELESPQKAWPYRKAAWLVDDLNKDIREIEDLRTLQGVGEKLAEILTAIIEELAYSVDTL
ncbi:MAG: radical SAM protein [Theionarchaea archaeon]|nr:radical SAM protein [Theionarchaea archaeon]MBU7000771.1 radical SAM protein [Theionarchaea archaeon]MBU7021446.1 radical SAM protein [Theionarchaea archaeon]MBU7033613.1 radical SAM protein [Theionarchaea archaeon]MBU7040735.1 radical SAM protein [Theionarchaea archaeon]